MDIKKVRALLDPLDTPEEYHGEIRVTFRAIPDRNDGAIRMYLKLAEKTYTIGSSSTGCTEDFEKVAGTYARALKFIKKAGLKPGY
jgi:hypothetical protein